MKLSNDWEGGLVTQFADWFIKKHALKLDDANTTRLAAEMCGNVEDAVNIEAPSREDVDRWVREEVCELAMDDWEPVGPAPVALPCRPA
jgi:hypothetical protein